MPWCSPTTRPPPGNTHKSEPPTGRRAIFQHWMRIAQPNYWNGTSPPLHSWKTSQGTSWLQVTGINVEEVNCSKLITSRVATFELQCVWHWCWIQDELAGENSILCKNDTLIVPHLMRNSAWRTLHIGDFGAEKMNLSVRNWVHWPGITQDIKATDQSCSTCQDKATSQWKETILPHEVPLGPW